MKIALYRKYRSARFADVIGQQAAAQALKNQIKSGKIGHSYIFTGIRGTGKTSFARILAKAVNCPNAADGEPCGVCDICRGIDDGSILDVTEIDAASNSGVDNIRELRDETAYAPSVCKMRVYIIDEVHMLTKEAFNALLKIMEEPPAHVMFILATTEIHKVPATILSRCQRFDLRRISVEDIAAHLLHIASLEGIDLTDDGAALIARLADGAMRDALSLLDTCASLGETVDEAAVARLTGLANKAYLFALAEDIRAKDIASLFARLGELHQNSLDASRLSTELLRHFRNLLMVKLSGRGALSDCSNDDIDRYLAQSEGYKANELIAILRQLADTADKLGAATDRMLLMELCFVRLCSDEPQPAAPVQKAQPAPRVTAASPAVIPANTPPWNVPTAQPEKAAQPARPSAAPMPPQADGAQKNTRPQPATGAQTRPADGEAVELQGWGRVIEALQSRSGMLYAFLQGSRAYLTASHVLIDGSPMFIQHIRENAVSKDLIKAALGEVTGINLPIGPFSPDKVRVVNGENSAPPESGGSSATQQPEEPTDALDALLHLAAQSGVEVEIKE